MPSKFSVHKKPKPAALYCESAARTAQFCSVLFAVAVGVASMSYQWGVAAFTGCQVVIVLPQLIVAGIVKAKNSEAFARKTPNPCEVTHNEP